MTPTPPASTAPTRPAAPSAPRPAGPPARIALVGDRSGALAAHSRIPLLLEALRQRDGIPVDPYWVPTPEAVQPGSLDGFDGIWLVPGGPYACDPGALAAARTARENGIPYLATCGGFQYTVVEFARSVCGLPSAAHAEAEPDAETCVVVPLARSLRGHEDAVRIENGSLAERVLGVERTVERYFCSYGVNPDFLSLLRGHGLRFSGVDDSGDVRILELPGHPFFLATLFQPEIRPDVSRPHPVIRAFAEAALARAAHRHATSRGMRQGAHPAGAPSISR